MIEPLDPTGLQFVFSLIRTEFEHKNKTISELSNRISVLETRINEFQSYYELVFDGSNEQITDSENDLIKSRDIRFPNPDQ